MESTLQHVAIIMDGNGRWACERKRPRVWGHVRGSSVVSEIIEEADELGLKALTLYTFSTENWSRPQYEIKILFALLKKYLIKERPRILKNNIKFRIMGDVTGLPKETVELIQKLEFDTQNATGLELSFAFGYGGRREIVDAANKFIEQNPGEKLTEQKIRDYLYIPTLPDVDLVIRTGGDQRISNYLLWQSAYAELAFTKSKWPDFTRSEFKAIIKEVETRERRFGAIESTKELSVTQDEAVKNKSLVIENGLGI